MKTMVYVNSGLQAGNCFLRKSGHMDNPGFALCFFFTFKNYFLYTNIVPT